MYIRINIFSFGGSNNAFLDVPFSIYLDRSAAYSSGLQELCSLRIHNPCGAGLDSPIDSLKPHSCLSAPNKRDVAWKRILSFGEKGSHIVIVWTRTLRILYNEKCKTLPKKTSAYFQGPFAVSFREGK